MMCASERDIVSVCFWSILSVAVAVIYSPVGGKCGQIKWPTGSEGLARLLRVITRV